MSPATSRAFVRSTVKLLFPQRLHDRLPGLLGDVVEGAVEAELGAPTVGDVDAELVEHRRVPGLRVLQFGEISGVRREPVVQDREDVARGVGLASGEQHRHGRGDGRAVLFEAAEVREHGQVVQSQVLRRHTDHSDETLKQLPATIDRAYAQTRCPSIGVKSLKDGVQPMTLFLKNARGTGSRTSGPCFN